MLETKRLNMCPGDGKPHNILLDPDTLVAKLCDLGSAKKLHAGGTSIAYICSRLYRSPELIMGAPNYSSKIDGGIAYVRTQRVRDVCIRCMYVILRILRPYVCTCSLGTWLHHSRVPERGASLQRPS